MNYYIASGLSNKELVNDVITSLNDRGYKNTYNWTLNAHPTTVEGLKTIGTDELHAVQSADVLIVMLPGGKGTHIEMGIALGRGIPVILVYPDNDFISVDNAASFYYVDTVRFLKYNETSLIDDLVALMH